jgi:hypothetical protein
MKNSEVKFLELKLTDDSVHYIPLGAILYWKKVPATSGNATIVLVAQASTTAISTYTITAVDDAGGLTTSPAEINAIIDALETDLVNAIKLLNSGSKNTIKFPGHEGATIADLVTAGTVSVAYTDASPFLTITVL